MWCSIDLCQKWSWFMLAVKTMPKMKTVKKEKVICYLLNGKRDYAKEKKIEKLLSDVLKMIE